MSTIRKFEFNKSHEIMFGLKIASKDPQTNKVTSVKCMFCIYFGKDDDLKDSKIKSTTKVKYFVYPSFRTDNYRSHLKLHKYKWEEYCKCSFEEKKLFFNFKEESIINRLESHFESNKNYKSYVIDSDVLDNIVSYLMFEENDFESKWITCHYLM